MVAGRGGSGGRGTGGSDNWVMFCVVCCGARENSVRLLRFGVNGSFYLNPEKFNVDWYKTLQVCLQVVYKLLTSCVHQTCIDIVEKLTT